MPKFARDKQGRRYYETEPGVFVPVMEDVTGVSRKALQGFTFGLSDELRGIAAGLGAMVPGGRTPGQAYGQAVEAERQALETFGQARPGASMAAEIGGGIASGLIPGGAVIRGGTLAGRTLAPAASIGSAVGRGAAVGGVGGGLAGFGYAEGGLTDRAVGAGVGAATGAALGAAIPAAGKAMQLRKPSAATLLRSVGRRTNQADIEGALQRMGPQATLADVNPSLQQMADVATARITPAQDLVDALGERAKGKVGRISRALAGTTGGIDDRAQTLGELVTIRRTQASPLYEQALNNAPAPPARLERLADLPQVDKIWQRVKASGQLQQRLGEISGEAIELSADDIERAMPSMKGWHFIQSRLGEEVRRLQRSGEVDASTIRELTQLRNVILGELDQLPGYSQARAIYGSTKGAEEAIAFGEKLLRMAPSDARAALKTMTPDELAFARLGLGTAVEDVVQSGLKEGAVPRTLRSAAFEEKLSALFPDNPGMAKRFMQTIDDELAMQSTFGLIQKNSQTAARQAIEEQMKGVSITEAVQAARRGDLPGLARGASDQVKDQLGQMLLSRDPSVRAQALQMMYAPQMTPYSRAALLGGMGIGTAAGGQVAPRGSETRR